MSNAVIKIEELSKQYRLGITGTGSLAHDMNRWWHAVRGKDDPYLKVGEENNRASRGQSDYVWALRDVSFDVAHGDVVGIVGRNGAGKSTLLKILSRTTAPTKGSIRIKGRVASLLEVGTGFHPELSGRDNIYLNGAILGMPKAEIARKFDEMVDFAGVERYIDTPVKRYSSGMYVRLAFAVAAHLDPEILVVDEVLAVGDQEFQKKCLGKMQDVSAQEGRTILFVSHNMGAVKTLCNRAVLMKNGRLDFSGSTNAVLDRYLRSGSVETSGYYLNPEPNKDSNILEIKVLGKGDAVTDRFGFEESIKISLKVRVAARHLDALLALRVRDQLERNVFTTEIPINRLASSAGEHTVFVTLPSSTLVPNRYEAVVGFHKPNIEMIEYLDSPVQFTIEETGTDFFQYAGKDYGCVVVNCVWDK